MSLTFTNRAQEITYRKVDDYLRQSAFFKNACRSDPDRPHFTLRYGSTMVEVEVLPWEVHPWEERDLAIVRASSCVTIGSGIDCELMHYLLAENRRMRFGAFHLDEANQVIFAHTVLGGENMDLLELQTCILSVVTIADTYDDLIVAKFGGKRFKESLAAAIVDEPVAG
ncbi:T3SS (YopN, CesT) and YbjN peptide-binding chaperone 1 [Trichothermofontia sp.]